MMRAVRFHQYGDPSVLGVEQMPIPEPKPTEVRVRVASSSLNNADIGGRQGIGRPVHARTLPYIPGYDIAGIVDRCGSAVSAFLPGERVYALVGLNGGGQAEYVCIDQERLAVIPERLDLADAGAVPLASLTALQALRTKAGVQAGQRVLINGATGGVGSFAVQIAKALGAHVTAVCAGSLTETARELGADVVMDYKAQNFTAARETWDVVFDAAGNRELREVQAVLAPNGTMVSSRAAPLDLLASKLTLSSERPHYHFVIAKASGHDLSLVSRLIDAGTIRPLIDSRYTIDSIQEAHRRFERGGMKGKVVVEVGL